MHQIKKYRKLLLFVIVWLGLSLLHTYNTGRIERISIDAELRIESTILHRLISQRADQHDAHLTSLSALAVSRQQPPADLLLQVAMAVRKFYPRIKAIDLIPFSPAGEPLTTRRPDRDLASNNNIIRTAALTSSGQLVMVPSPMNPGSYLLVKRSPNSKLARFGLALEIDGSLLAQTDAIFWKKSGATAQLSLLDDTTLINLPSQTSEIDEDQAIIITVEKKLSSRSQPLLLTTKRLLQRSDIYPIQTILTGIVVIWFLLAVSAFLVSLVLRIRSAETRARLGEHEARIAHATRINALGEMASGMAHELTQPLTAILSQSQAGIRLIANNFDRDTLKAILTDNVTQSKRAADILSRLRSWTRKAESTPHQLSLNEAMRNVSFLLRPELSKKEITLAIREEPGGPVVLGNAVELEQVIFNLVRNAIEAFEGAKIAGARIDMTSRIENGKAVLEVKDNGPGIPEEMLDHLFEPFVSGKEDGMGLGLSLCERIVERFEGQITITNREEGGAIAWLVFPLSANGVQD